MKEDAPVALTVVASPIEAAATINAVFVLPSTSDVRLDDVAFFSRRPKRLLPRRQHPMRQLNTRP